MTLAEMYFQINEVEYARITRDPRGEVGRELLKRAERLRVLARKQVGKKTGRLAADIRVTLSPTSTGLVAYVGSNNRIALMHHNGTRPHPIVAKTGRMLRFAKRGKIVYARKVMHPGTRPNRYLTDNLRRVVVD